MNHYSRQLIEQDDIDAVAKVLQSGYITGGKKVEEFENALSDYVGVEFATVVNSATSALHCAYNAIGLMKGDEVITTPISFVATANMIVETGATPIFVDIFYNGNINPKKIEEAITAKTKAIVTVDFGGNPVDVQAIREIADRYNLVWISDSSHALGSEVGNQKVGSHADLSIFSFHAIKPITTGEGGAIVTNNQNYHASMQKFRSHGVVKKNFWNQDMQSMGFNYRLSDIACALGISQLKKLDRFISLRKAVAEYYDKRFKENSYFMINVIGDNIRSSYHLYPIMLRRDLWCRKEDIIAELKERGVGVQVHYKPIFQHSYYKDQYKEQKLYNSIDFYKAELSIPCHQGMSIDDAKAVADILIEVFKKHSSLSQGIFDAACKT